MDRTAKIAELEARVHRLEARLAGKVGALKMPTTAQEWQLFSDMPGVGVAARALTAALQKAATAISRGLAVLDDERSAPGVVTRAYYRFVYPVMTKYARWGASDTEPRNVAQGWLEKYAESLGYHFGYLDF